MRSIDSSLNEQYAVTLDVVLDIDGVGEFTNIIGIPDIDTALAIDNVATQSIQIQLDDTDDRVSNVLAQRDIHKTKANISINGTVFFYGQIVGPAQEDEDQRLFTLTLTSQVEAEEYGFSPERGEVDHVSPEAIGKAWPLVFGSPRYVPAVRVYHQPHAISEDRFCTVDPLLYENRRRLINAYGQALFMFYYFDKIRAAILDVVDQLPYQNAPGFVGNAFGRTNIVGYKHLYEWLIQAEEALQDLMWASMVELNVQRAQNQRVNDRASAQRIAELEVLVAQITEESNEIAQVKEGLQDVIDYLQVLFEAEKQATAQQLTWINQAYSIYENYLRNEEVICEQERCTKASIRVRGIDLPTGNIDVIADNIRYKVSVSGTTMTFNSGPLEVYRDIVPDAWAVDDDPCNIVGSGMDVIWLTENVNLRGMYLLVKKREGLDYVRHIVRVKDQVGLKVYFELIPWQRDGSGGPRGQSVDGLLNEILSYDDDISRPTNHPFDFGSSYGGFGGINTFGNFGSSGYFIGDVTGSYRKEILDIIARNPNITKDELINFIRLLSYERLDKLSQVQFTGPTPRDLFTIIGPDIELIEGAAGEILPHWFDYYIPPEEYDNGDHFIDHPVGTELRYGDTCNVYVANLIESTVHAVHAYRRTVDGDRVLEAVPTSYYSVDIRDLTKYDTTTLVFDPPLTELNEGWEETIYVTQTSTVGRNVVDVVDWFFATYTSLTPANDIRATVDNYPVDFALFDTGDTLAQVRDILYQARIGFRSNGSTYELIYLPEQPSSATTLTSADILRDTRAIIHGSQPITKVTATWNGGDYLPKDEPYEVIVRNNIPTYGLLEKTEEYTIYSIQELVEKSVQFNMLRNSHSWIRVDLQSTTHKWILEPLDGVTLDGKLHLVEQASIGPTDGTLKLTLNSGTIVGTSDQFEFFWPKAAAVEPWNNNDPYEISGSIK